MKRGTFVSALSLSVIVAAMTTSTASFAQDGNVDFAGQGAGSLDIERFRPTADANSIVDVESGTVTNGALDAGLIFGFTLNPLAAVGVDGNGGADALRTFPIVQQRYGAHLVGNIAFTDSFALGVEVPGVLYQTGPAFVPGVAGKNPVALVGLDDVRLVPKLELLTDATGNSGLAVVAHVTLPTALPRHQYIGDGLPTIEPEVAASTSFSGLKLAMNAGVKLRAPSTFGSAVQGQELTYRAGVAYGFRELVGLPLELQASLNGAALLFPEPFSAGNNPLEGLVALGVDVGSVQIFAAGGTALVGAAGVPLARALLGVKYSGAACADDDRDSVCNDVDRCPSDVEDIDGVEDSDGCADADVPATTTTTGPEGTAGVVEKPATPSAPVDSDGDGIVDNLDKCFAEPEVKNGVDDDDGCPDIIPLVPGDKIPLPNKIAFQGATTSPTDAGRTALDAAAKFLREHPEIKLVRVEAHTESSDTSSGFQRNLTLSKKRADAVKAYLVKAGVEAKRITVKGFGGARPVDTNATEEGRENNRRVDIVVEK